MPPYVHPITLTPLHRHGDSFIDPDGGDRFPVVRDIPRFCDVNNYSESFGYQWNLFDQTQLDVHSGADQSQQRFYGETGWDPDELSGYCVLEVGDGAGRNALLSLAQELGIAEQVILAGFHSDPTPFYKTTDLFALSSHYEGFGNVIVEALGCGIPVVSTDCPSGPAEILENGRFGRLVPVGDAGALAVAMSDALSAPVDRRALISRAGDFAPEIAARKYLDVLEAT